MKCVIAFAVLAVALPAAMSAPRPGFLHGSSLLRSADLLDGAVIAAAPAVHTVAVAPASISSHSTVVAHPSPAIAYHHVAPAVYAHSAPAVVAHAAPAVVASPVALAPAGRTTVIAGPSGTITETQGVGSVAVPAW